MPINTKAIIIDDEPASTQLLETLLKEFTEIKNIYSFNNPVKGFEALKTKEPDILFLDMNMPGLCGIEILQLIQTFKIHVHVIIITAHKELIMQAAHFSMIDFLLKPFSTDDLKNSLDKYMLHKEQHNRKQKIDTFLNHLSQKIRIPTSFEELFFAPEEISYLEADGAYTQIYLANDKKITSSFHLGRVQELLPPNIFFRISRKHIINFSYLFKIDKKSKKCMLNHQVKYTALPFSKSLICKSGLLPE